MTLLSRLFAAFRPKPLTEEEAEYVLAFVEDVRTGEIRDEEQVRPAWRPYASLALRHGYITDGGFWSANPGYAVTRKGERFLEEGK